MYGACIYIFCNPLLQNIIQVNCLTLYEFASVKVINKKKKKKSDPHFTSYAELGRHILLPLGCMVIQYYGFHTSTSFLIPGHSIHIICSCKINLHLLL